MMLPGWRLKIGGGMMGDYVIELHHVWLGSIPKEMSVIENSREDLQSSRVKDMYGGGGVCG